MRRGRDAHTSTADSLRAAVEGFITACWDIGPRDRLIGAHASTNASSEARHDVTVQTALLESRSCAARGALFAAFRRANDAAMDPQAFLRAKTLEMRQRHVKYEDTPYSLEPNCKESPGGLRDLQVVIWVARAAGLGQHLERTGGQGPDHALRGQAAASATKAC